MATPEKKPTVGDRLSASDAVSEAVEGSPVFNYIYNLSPIKPVKSVHLSNSFQELNYASPCVFASPKTSSMNRATALRRDQFASSSEVKFFPDVEENKPSVAANVVECPHSTEAAVKVKYEKEDSDSRIRSSCSALGGLRHDDHNSSSVTNLPISQLNVVIESYQIVHGPMGSVTPSYNVKAEPRVAIPRILPSPDIQVPGIPSSVVQLVNIFNTNGDESERHIAPGMQTYTDKSRNCVADHSQKNDVEPGCDLPDMVADDVDEFFIFSPSTQTEADLEQIGQRSNQSANFASSFVPKHSQFTTNGWTNTQVCDSLHSSYIAREQEPGKGSREAYGQEDVDLTPQMPSMTMQNTVSKGDKIEKTDDRMACPDSGWIPLGCKTENQQLRGVRRRCLVFEAAEGQKTNMEGNSLFNASNASYADKLSPDDKQLISCDVKLSSKRTLSGIGLHLNSLASPSLGGRVTKIEAGISGDQIENKVSSLAAGNPAFVNQKVIERSVDLKSADRDSDISGDKTSYVQSEIVPTAEFGDDMIEQSPKKKRRKATQSGEKEGCKRCHCKKSKCLKLYCECFAAGIYCVDVCSCQGCLNKPEHEDTVIETRERIENRNPFAFAPKIVKPPEPVLENKEASTKVSILPRHKTGCNCKKSKCTKKYCECFQGGVACSSGCRCEGCTNAFGKKEGVYDNLLLLENSDCSHRQPIEDLSKRSREVENTGLETREAAEPVQNLEIQEIQKDDKQSSRVSSMSAFEICRSAILPALLSSSNPPQTSRISGCSATTNTGFLLSRLKSEKHFMRTIMEDDTPEFLRVNESPNNRVTVASPNRKRVSPPHINAGVSLGSGSHRKLVLHPISSLQQVGIAPSRDNLQAKF